MQRARDTMGLPALLPHEHKTLRKDGFAILLNLVRRLTIPLGPALTFRPAFLDEDLLGESLGQILEVLLQRKKGGTRSVSRDQFGQQKKAGAGSALPHVV